MIYYKGGNIHTYIQVPPESSVHGFFSPVKKNKKKIEDILLAVLSFETQHILCFLMFPIETFRVQNL